MKIYFKYSLPVFLFLIACFVLCSFYSCNENTADPIIETGSRNYIWEEDTLDVPIHSFISYRDIVANTPDDIYLGNLDPGLWYYDGEKWEESQFPGVTPSALWLFEDNTLWIGTRQNLILKRENGAWSKSYNLVLGNYDRIYVFGMYGKDKNNIYAVGWASETIIPMEEYVGKGIILHFDGNDWQFLNIPNLEEIGLHRILYQENIDTYFIRGIKTENGIILDKIFTFDGNNINEIMSSTAGIGLSQINDQVYMNSNQKVYKYINNKLVLWKDFTGTEFLSSFVGRNENDFFNNSANGVGHYNGIDYMTIYPTVLEIYTKIIFEKEIFITALDYYNHHYIIIHGTLKE